MDKSLREARLFTASAWLAAASCRSSCRRITVRGTASLPLANVAASKEIAGRRKRDAQGASRFGSSIHYGAQVKLAAALTSPVL
jgi:hypothetical protein